MEVSPTCYGSTATLVESAGKHTEKEVRCRGAEEVVKLPATNQPTKPPILLLRKELLKYIFKDKKSQR